MERSLLCVLLFARSEVIKSYLRLARHLVSHARFLRVNTVTAQGSYALDGPKGIGELADLGNRAALETEEIGQVKSHFVSGVSVSPWEKFTKPQMKEPDYVDHFTRPIIFHGGGIHGNRLRLSTGP